MVIRVCARCDQRLCIPTLETGAVCCRACYATIERDSKRSAMTRLQMLDFLYVEYFMEEHASAA